MTTETTADRYTPEHEHDCKACRFLFRTGHGDAYWCIENGTGDAGSVILRYSATPENYSSMPVETALCTRGDSPASRALRETAEYLLRQGLVELRPALADSARDHKLRQLRGEDS